MMAAVVGGGFGVAADAKVCLNPAAYSLSCPANDFLDSTDYAADTNFTATDRSATLLSFHAPAVTQLA
jgi:hypothetical protein